MALIFPISPIIGQTYQSGSSNTYEWTGTYWKIKNITTANFVGKTQYNIDSASFLDKIVTATNEGQFALTSSNNFTGEQTAPSFNADNLTANDRAYLRNISGIDGTPIGIYSDFNISGSIIPATANGTFTSSFSLGSTTNAWKDLYISHGSIIFVDAITQETSSFSIATDPELGNNTVQYTAAITASKFIGDGGGLYNLPTQTYWNKDKTYRLRNTEQLTISDDYVLENSYLRIDGGEPNSIGNWINVNPDNNDATINKTGNNTYRIDGPNDNNNNGYIYIKRNFDTPTTMSIGYNWSNSDAGEDWPIYEVSEIEPTDQIDNTTRLQNNSANQESGTWQINVPSGSWLAIGIYSTDSCCGSGSLSLTLPYIINENVEYSPGKYFKKEGKIFIGGNLLLKDSVIENNGKISVGGEVILIGNSQIIGTGTII